MKRRLRRAFGNPIILLVCVSVLVLAVSGCRAKTGTYAPVDLAAELHYSQGARAQEPPRLTSPLGAVPHASTSMSGPDQLLTPARYRLLEQGLTMESAKQLVNPIPFTEAGLVQGAELFRVNCSFCHGAGARGDGPVNEFLQNKYFSIPAPNLVGDEAPTTMSGTPTNAKTDGEVFLLVSQGGFTKTQMGMPEFRLLLIPEQRWLLVNYLRALQGGN
jgi:mono/diheme cytochrome c family protein